VGDQAAYIGIVAPDHSSFRIITPTCQYGFFSATNKKGADAWQINVPERRWNPRFTGSRVFAILEE